jgi:hypothetical protein
VDLVPSKIDIMKVIFLETTNATPHIETSLELAKLHLEKGDEVEFHFLGHAVPFSEFVVRKSGLLFPGCLPEKRGVKFLECSSFRYFEPRLSKILRSIQVPKFDSINELRHYSYKSYNAGLSALSSLVSHTKNSNPNLEKNKILLDKLLKSGIGIYEYTKSTLHSVNPDLVYLFNGRFSNNRAILDALKEVGVEFLIHERGANKRKYSVRAFMPHDFEKIRAEMLSTWSQADVKTRKEVANQFFEDRYIGAEQGWKSFTSAQKKGVTLSGFSKSGKLITYYSSSDDEYVAVGDIVKWDRWQDQLSAVRDLISIVRQNSELALVIRIHPHMAEKDLSDLKPWLDLDIPDNARIVLPTDELDTYAQIQISDLVVTCGSTVGIESVYWGTPSICLGPSLYSNLGSVYLPAEISELRALLLSESLEVHSCRALPYGYYMATFGTDYLYYDAETLHVGKFMGTNLQSFGMCGFIRRLRRAVSTNVKSLFDSISKDHA